MAQAGAAQGEFSPREIHAKGNSRQSLFLKARARDVEIAATDAEIALNEGQDPCNQDRFAPSIATATFASEQHNIPRIKLTNLASGVAHDLSSRSWQFQWWQFRL
jgi:hypothetical protein